MKLEDRMSRSIKQRASVVILRSDFARMGSDSQVGRVLARFVESGMLIRVSKGAFAKTRINKFTGKPTPAGTLEMIAAELFRKLKISVAPGALVSDYNSGRSTQIPMGATINTGRRRISRKVTVGNSTLSYEKNHRRAEV
ncbi:MULTISPECIES: DUF6088 family protein [Pseudomonas syringae group]|uniref:S-adenosylhomocysteine hydrolase n=3 Tax=Pseudomonas syringae group TaxID=136849 RepID=A0A2K4VYK9_PSESX|nr:MULTISPECIES: DUF6088 family protein [Pseudomonas syringae group]EGH98064.1 hypothetical protein PLA106_18359 [Pseudomonas amygdali pv. lachrymans str. M302278]KWT11566.1 S-adenosylhomocysteine hydrolase [Pseudomonas syringae pv. avii]PHN62523.1 S-adenosylhomocysteine hydrolase [Pseudomonas syringae]POQ07937.1 S-adenosylhomocysteine hydrolase [Pseudomonas syringae pv. avii]RMM11227.1 hypothetical protein ALQ85_101211 [Pseudomonas syringae]